MNGKVIITRQQYKQLPQAVKAQYGNQPINEVQAEQIREYLGIFLESKTALHNIVKPGRPSTAIYKSILAMYSDGYGSDFEFSWEAMNAEALWLILFSHVYQE